MPGEKLSSTEKHMIRELVRGIAELIHVSIRKDRDGADRKKVADKFANQIIEFIEQ